jgi:hypothetical protein
LVYFSCFGILSQEKSGNPGHHRGTFFPLSKKIVDGDKFFSPVKKITCSYERRFVMEINSHKQPKDLEKKMRRMIYLRHSQFDAG